MLICKIRAKIIKITLKAVVNMPKKQNKIVFIVKFIFLL